jgi:hypothetical protein
MCQADAWFEPDGVTSVNDNSVTTLSSTIAKDMPGECCRRFVSRQMLTVLMDKTPLMSDYYTACRSSRNSYDDRMSLPTQNFLQKISFFER